MKKLKFMVLVLFIINSAFAGESMIPLKKDARIPSDDLVYNDQVLSSKEAIDLENVDLSSLNPSENDIYNGNNNSLNDDTAIQIENEQSFTYSDQLGSNSGLLRFNAVADSDGSVVIIHLDKTLHTMLLRKNILRKLGYIISPMKWLSKVKVKFNSKEEKEQFLKRTIPENTLGAFDRWVIVNNETEVVLQDVVVTVPNESDYYNTAMGIPNVGLNSRTVRALALVYDLLDLKESVNQYSWSTGKIDNNALMLSHFTENEFNSSYDDIVWMMRKINLISREEIKSAIDHAKFPAGVSELLVEKIISRRNTLNELLNLKSKEKVNNELNVDGLVKDGKLVKENFEGYAARFSYGDALSPLDQMRFYLYSKLQSNIIDNGISYINTKLQGYNLSDKRNEYFIKQFQDGLKHFIATGELLPIQVGTWNSPIANFKLILSRDIVIGNYLGTENLVQLADTIGAAVNLGYKLGVEGLPYGASGGAKTTVSISRTFTHLKPVKSLKQSLKEPYRNLFVPLLKKSLKDDFFSLAELKDFSGTTDERSKKIQAVLTELEKNLGVGESLLLTDRIMPSVGADVNYNQGIIGTGVGLVGSTAVIKRIHFYKKSASVLQIFDDKGHTKTLDLNLHVNALGNPVLSFHQTFDKGRYNVKSYMVNISSDLEKNPSFFENAMGIFQVLKHKDFELISKNVTPVEVDANYFDKQSGFSFLLWKLKKIKGQTFYDVKARDGVNGKYFSYQNDFLSGTNIESMTKEIANYYLSEKVDPNVSITDESDKNPGETYLGKSHTETFRFESEVNSDGKFEKKFMTLVDLRQGWTMSDKKLFKFIQKVNEKFNMNLFNKEQIDFKKLKLYKIGYHLNIYENGIAKLENINLDQINQIEERYKTESQCGDEDPFKDSLRCGNLYSIKNTIKQCKKSKLDEGERAICHTKLFERLYTDLKFEDFKTIIGENNFYLYGSVDGLRKKSEVLNDTIYSNSIGRISSQYWNGPLDVVRNLIGLSDGEFAGGWLRGGL